MEWPVLKTPNPSKLPSSIKHFSVFNAAQSHASWHGSEELHHLRQVVIVLRELFGVAVPWLEEEVTGGHFKHHAREGPIVGSRIIFAADDDFGRSILSCLNFGRKVMISPASITEIANLQFHRLIKFGTTLLCPLFLDLLLHILRIKHILI